MATKRKIVYEAREEDLERLVRDGAAEGAQLALERLEEEIGDIRLLGRLKAGLITIEDICRLYDVSRQTVYNWGLEPIDYPGQLNLYRLKEIAKQLEKK